MELLKQEERKNLIGEVCGRFHKDGISRLEIVGHFEKYTPKVHFRIAEPNDGNFIYTTDLFGEVDIKPGLFNGGVRMQYHGNYEGLSQIIIQGINMGLTRPAFRLHASGMELTDKERLHFDESLKYIIRGTLKS